MTKTILHTPTCPRMRLYQALARHYTKLSDSALKRLGEDGKWLVVDGKLSKRFTLRSHTAAAEFVLDVAQEADSLNHHPDVRIKYRSVHFALRTNDAKILSTADEELAQKIDATFKKRTD